MPEIGETRADGKVWTGNDFGWQNPATIWKDQTPGREVGEKRTLPVQKLYQSALLNSPGKISKFTATQTTLAVMERTDQEQIMWNW